MTRLGIYTVLLMLILISCEGKLTEEQRKALRKEMKDHQIKKISEEEIYKKAFDMGRSFMVELNRGKAIDAVLKTCNCNIAYLENTDSTVSKVEKDLFEAYQYNHEGKDNIQKDGDWLIYSKPYVEADTLKGVWYIKLSKKDVIKSI